MEVQWCRERSAALACWEESLKRREAEVVKRELACDRREEGLDAWVAQVRREGSWPPPDDPGGPAVVPAWTVPPGPVVLYLSYMKVVTGDDVATMARGLGLDADWLRRLLDGEIGEIDIPHVQQLCEGLACNPYELLGWAAARSIEHAYRRELWPRNIEPLEDWPGRPR